MDWLELFKSYNPQQKNIFTGFCIALPLSFTVLYLYVPDFQKLDFYIQITFSASTAIMAIYYSFILFTIACILGRTKYFIDIITLILPLLVTAYHVLHNPENYNKGYEYPLIIFLRYNVIFFTILSIYGFIMRKCREYEIKHERQNVDDSE